MRSARRATRKSVGSELSLHEVRQKYDEIRQGPEIKREETLHLVQQFFEADDVEVNAKKVSLICPDAVRGSRCRHIECFDLRSYLEYHTNLAYWECPFTFCREQVTCDQLRVDEYTTDVVLNIGDDVHAIEVFGDGTFNVVQDFAPAVVTTIKDEEPFIREPSVSAAVKVEQESRDDNEPPNVVPSDNVTTNSAPQCASTSSPGVECDQCHKRLSNKKSLVEHYRQHTGERPYKCRHCEKSFVTASHRKVHERTHTGEKPFQCPQCPKRFAQRSGIPSHLLTHTDQRPFACTKCGLRFKAEKNLASHKRMHEESKAFECNQCGSRFPQLRGLRDHSRVHNKSIVQSHECTECGARFTALKRLVSHQRVHSDDRHFKCANCPKSFKYAAGLVNHKKFHTGERPFKCIECGAAFTQEVALNVHKRIHSGEVPFKCHRCDRSFRYATSLTAHLRAHNGDKPYKCGECNASFVQYRGLKDHKPLHANNGPIRCALCSCTFKKRNALVIHWKHLHAEHDIYEFEQKDHKSKHTDGGL
ncbi:zinc finger protein [Aphelenchoides avenae]|nr:zinc finger protein [Aphelenchus avenae]